jgi:hypothetical protein
MNELYVQQSLKRITKKIFVFEQVNYASSADVLDDALPSEAIMMLLLELNTIGYEMHTSLNKVQLLTSIIEGLFDFMLQDQCWTTPHGPRHFGLGGVQQMVLDIHLLLRICEKFISDSANEKANLICEKGLKAYFTLEQD